MSLGAEPSNLSGKYLEQDYLFNGDEHVFPQGFSQVINVLAKDIKVNLNEQISNVNYEHDNILLTNSHGQVYRADHSIVTVPLGILKTNDILTFTPPLS